MTVVTNLKKNEKQNPDVIHSKLAKRQLFVFNLILIELAKL